MTVCRSCKAPVIWALTEQGNSMPIDQDPVEGGSIKLEPGHPPIARVVPKAEREGLLYTSHFARCPYAERHRRR